MAAAVQRIKLACGICDADSDGVHFGAESCAACAAFFRRSVALGKKYSCRREGACLTNKSLRCICRACRFKKCVLNGMDSTLVQLARDDNRTKLKQPQPLEQPDAAEKIEIPISSISPSKAAQKSELINKMLLAYKQLLHNRTVTYCSNSLMSMLINDDDSMEQVVNNHEVIFCF
uniref:Nuclear receptor domain-containing protein n=1 Tax=Plectus sambesii TaxID=2011161 RepID=A0A914X8I3_9BILA